MSYNGSSRLLEKTRRMNLGLSIGLSIIVIVISTMALSILISNMIGKIMSLHDAVVLTIKGYLDLKTFEEILDNTTEELTVTSILTVISTFGLIMGCLLLVESLKGLYYGYG